MLQQRPSFSTVLGQKSCVGDERSDDDLLDEEEGVNITTSEERDSFVGEAINDIVTVYSGHERRRKVKFSEAVQEEECSVNELLSMVPPGQRVSVVPRTLVEPEDSILTEDSAR